MIVASYFSWVSYWSPDAKANRELGQKIERVNQAMADFETAMRNDTYGGKTPQETLNMFIDALKKGDVELASKYFMLDTNTQSPNYLTKKEWTKILKNTIKAHGVEEVVGVLSRTVFLQAESIYEGDSKFISKNPVTGMIDMYINLERNKYSGVWKIESL